LSSIFYSRYQLVRQDGSGTHFGCLLKIEDANKNWGVADISPLPHLGDLSVDEEIRQKGPLFRQALRLAQRDLEARKNSICLIDSRPVAINTLMTDYKTIAKKGTIKVKGDQHFPQLISYLQKMPELKIRLDFNSRLSPQAFNTLIEQLPKNIEYIEDPTIWNSKDWIEWNKQVPMAVDFSTENPFQHLNAWTYLIIKPSRQNADDLIAQCRQYQKKFTLTSAMEHPVGFAHGLHYAQNYSENVTGFSTLELYEKLKFNECFVVEENQISMKPSGYGIGMTELLQDISWTIR